ncbi:hypothetical protein PR048_029759 [Dryococelus australis]|uniref:Uncharacterized protein n=1 Tax=Dryococelus australis TaxID=614101 RepID=A0ABQ9G9Y8_9NEOP|nr:hypothetical protein PR048_029759 [Dryococelus australis]
MSQFTRAVFCRSSDKVGTECEDVLDVELAIAEIEKHPEIWNVAAEELHDRYNKRSAWIGIGRPFSDGFDGEEENENNQS